METQCSIAWLKRLVTLGCLLLSFSMAWAQTSNPQTQTKGPEKKTLPGKGSERASGATSNPFSKAPQDDYVIGPEDVLAINVWREPEISRIEPVRPDGKISLPLIGDLEANGLTPLKLRDIVVEKLKAYIANPEVTVIVQEVRSQRFNIVGAVSRPGSYDLAKPLTVLDAIAVAGGFQEFAKVNKIYVLRRMADGSRKRLPFNYKAVIKGRRFDQNVELKSGDTIVVP